MVVSGTDQKIKFLVCDYQKIRFVVLVVIPTWLTTMAPESDGMNYQCHTEELLYGADHNNDVDWKPHRVPVIRKKERSV